MDRVGCDPLDAGQCIEKYSNVNQSDLDGDGIGDRCEPLPVASGLTIKPTPELGGFFKIPLGGYIEIIKTGTTYDVAFKTEGGTIHADTLRTGVRVGACGCDKFTEDGEWDLVECMQPHICNGSGEENSATLDLAWNPINAPECRHYPTNNSLSLLERTEISSYQVCHEKVVAFIRDRERESHYFEWDWQESRIYRKWENSLQSYFDADTTGRKTKARVAWPNYPHVRPIRYYPQPDPHNPENLIDQEVAYSNAVEVAARKGSITRGDIYLVPQFVISVIPGIVNGWWDPRGPLRPGYLLGADPVSNTAHVYGLQRHETRIERIWQIDAPGMEIANISSAAAGLIAGELIGSVHETASAVFIYQDTTSGFAAGGNPAPAMEGLFIGEENEDSFMEMISAEDLLGAQTPVLADAKLLYLSRLQQLLLLGRPVGADHIEAWKLSFIRGSWEGPYHPALPGAIEDYSVVYDDVRDKVYFVGSAGVGPVAAPEMRLYAMDTSTFKVWQRGRNKDAPPEAYRENPGVYLDAHRARLYVYGGMRDGEPLGDLWAADMLGGSWEKVAETDGPALAVRPFVYHDRVRGLTRIAYFEGNSVFEPVHGAVLDREGVWREEETQIIIDEPEWPVATVYKPGSPRMYPVHADSWVALPGQPYLAVMETPDGSLGLRVMGQRGDVIGESAATQAGREEVGFICPPGEICILSPVPRFEQGEGGSINYTLSVVSADLAQEASAKPKGKINDTTLKDGVVYAAGGWGLAALGPDLSLIGMKQGSGFSGLNAVEECGEYLCSVRNGAKGLTVFDVTDPTDIQVKGEAVTTGHGSSCVHV